MDTTTFDTFTRFVTTATAKTRRSALGGLVALGAAAAGGDLFHADNVAARKKKKKNRKRKKKKGKNTAEEKTTPPSPAPENVCKGKNWCVDRAQTCGPAGGYGKCLVEATGDNICAEILFQTNSCADCAPPACNNCRCALAAGGGDRCNNGANGYDFICVREV
jgi:hypothetical protein